MLHNRPDDAQGESSSAGTNHRRYEMRRRHIPLMPHDRMPECGIPGRTARRSITGCP
jgi:hypothetical protein